MPPTFFAEMLSKKIAEMPPLLLLGELRKKICAKQKIGEGVVNCWWGGEYGKCTYGPRLFYVS